LKQIFVTLTQPTPSVYVREFLNDGSRDPFKIWDKGRIPFISRRMQKPPYYDFVMLLLLFQEANPTREGSRWLHD